MTPPEDADALLVDGVCALEDYVNEHQRACEKLKQGLFKLTMARRHLAPHALSDLSYHEFFDAATVVAPRSDLDHLDNDDDNDASDSKATDVHWRLTSPDTERLASNDSSSNAATPALTQRKGKSTSSKSTSGASEVPSAAESQQQRERQNATILWFSSLPPSDLRQAQTHFRSALQALLYAAASASKVQHCVQALSEP